MRDVYVVFDPEMLTAEFLSSRTAVVIDVLRATSSMIQALANGATQVRPVGEVDEARALRRELPAGTVVLGGEREGLRIDGFDLGNTPQEFAAPVVAGKTVVMTTTNGTRAILLASSARRLFIAALTNAAATAAELCRHGDGGDIVLVGSGTERRISWEDSLCAGAIVQRLLAAAGDGEFHLTDSALIALELWNAWGDRLDEALRRGRGGYNVVKRGLHDAFAACAAIDTLPVVAEVHRDPLRVLVRPQ
ncbi:MAG TPA: 2-phosphosulfolactate phosphatase [Phycisphaerae bacterium]|nr:2-phosphosulfolactate phosphatase [Phycisphaerae bacterium]